MNYGSVFVVLDILGNYEDEIEGLKPGKMIVTVKSLFMLDETIVNGTKQKILH